VVIRLALACMMLAIAIAPVRAETTSRTVAETDDLSEAIAEAIAAQRAVEGKRVLLVFDIDNTLLTMPQYLGSDRWFNHNAELIAAGHNPDFATMDHLISAQAMLFGLSTMELTQPDIPDLIMQATNAGIDVMLLTARGPDFFDVSVRELERNGVRWKAPTVCSIILCSADGRFDEIALTRALAHIGVPAPEGTLRPIKISQGVMLVAGQNKGALLDLLITALGQEHISQVVFVDDSERNVIAVAGSNTAVPLSVYHYRRVPTAVSDREARAGSKQYRLLMQAICSNVQSALCASAATSLDGASK